MGELTMGLHSYGTPIRRGTANTVTIGKYCSIAEGVIFDGGFNHNTKLITTYPLNRLPGLEHVTGHPVVKGDIIVGNDVWIGEDAIIMSGVTIGDGAVIGARSIISHDVEPYTIMIGAPARLRAYRLAAQAVAHLKWWDWPEEKIREHAQLLMSENVNELIKHHE